MIYTNRVFFFTKAVLGTVIFANYAYSSTVELEIKNCLTPLKAALSVEQEKPSGFHKCPVSKKLATWVYLNSANKKIPFNDYKNFIEHNSHWPRMDFFHKKAEKTLYTFDPIPHVDTLKWFEKHPPQSLEGVTIYARALLKDKHTKKATDLLQKTWINKDQDEHQERLFHKEFLKYLPGSVTWQRVDRFLWEGNTSAAKKLLKFLSKDHTALAQVRIALIEGKANGIEDKLNAVPARLKQNSGLLFDRVRWNRKKDQNDKMVALLNSVSSQTQHTHQGAWWNERNILMRRYIEENQYQNAYTLLSHHALTTENSDYVHAEWMAGWLSLRFLHNPDKALKHFAPLAAKVKTPISKARIAYWLGETYHALKNEEKAKEEWNKAAQHPETYYGQLACEKVGKTGSIVQHFHKAGVISTKEKSEFHNNDLVMATKLLAKVGDKSDLEPFFAKLAQNANTLNKKRMVVELASQIGTNFLTLHHAKNFTIFNHEIYKQTFPVLPEKYLKGLNANEKALVHSLIRQESRFKADAISPAGARGLMQMMKDTARKTGQKHKLPYKNFDEVATNIKLGTAHVRDLLKLYDHYLVFVFSAYNAGSLPVTKWASYFGDPRKQKLDLIDWVELIPFGETRNYVQRVLENYMVYREMFGLKPKPLIQVMKELS